MKTILKSLVCGALLTAGLVLVPTVNAQAEGPTPTERPERPQRPEGAGPRADRLAQLTEQLGLTEAQSEQLRPIFAAQQAEVQAIRRNATADSDRAAIRESMQAVREKYQGKIAAVLTDEQKAKWAKLQERGPRPGPGAGGPPPAAKAE